MSFAESEKRDKKLAHRRHRNEAKALLQSAVKGDADSPIYSREHRRSGRALFAKDGKQWLGDRHPKLMRK